MRTSKKTCFRCGAEKPLTDYYAHPMMADGHLNKCKECAKADVRANRRDKLDYYRAYDRERGNRQTKADRGRHRERYPQKYQARYAVSNAIRDGRLARQPCEQCGSDEHIHAHHEDYSRPLDVRWLCRECHWQQHTEF